MEALSAPPQPRSVAIPKFIYGTAWKGAQTASLVHAALESGFRGLDTAAQPRHYRKELVGEEVRQFLDHGHAGWQQHVEANRRGLSLSVQLQTKFTSLDGQDQEEQLPYRAIDPIVDQIRASVRSSLAHLQVHSSSSQEESYINCFLLHSPLDTLSDTLLAWRTLGEFVPHRIRHLGISNVNRNNLGLIYDLMDVKPAAVQNRWYHNPDDPFDEQLRGFCVRHGIVYQAFSVLTGNPGLLECAPVQRIAGEIGIAHEVALYCLFLELGSASVLNGTTNVGRMRSDLVEYDRCRNWVREHGSSWRDVVAQFQMLIAN
ncbi:MAG: hypothetical protein Q9207_007173 [Kuettlingeria erythrocarpa]